MIKTSWFSPHANSGLAMNHRPQLTLTRRDMTIKQAAIDRTRPPNVKPGTYTPAPDILTWLDTL